MASYDTGHGATLTLSTTTVNGLVRSINVGAETLGKVNRSALATTGFHEYIPADLAEPPEVTMTFVFDSEVALPGKGTVETATITYPNAGTTAATYAGTGFITSVKPTDLNTDQLQEIELTFAFDGLTGPTYTVQS